MKKLLFTAILAFAIGSAQAQTDNQVEEVAHEAHVASPKIKVFPNPATNVVNVLGLLNSNSAQITISDMYGKILISHEWEIRKNALNIPIANLEPGIYAIVIHSKEQQVKTKFYKQ